MVGIVNEKIAHYRIIKFILTEGLNYDYSEINNRIDSLIAKSPFLKKGKNWRSIDVKRYPKALIDKELDYLKSDFEDLINYTEKEIKKMQKRLK